MADYVSGPPKDSGGNPVPVTWTDDPIQQDITEPKKQHLVEMRAALQALDGHYHVFNGNDSQPELPDVAVSWLVPNANIIIDETFVAAQHINEIIGFIKNFVGHYHYVPGYGKNSTTYSPSFSFEDDPVSVDVTWIKASAHEELRTHLESLAGHTHSVCCECECQCTCTCTCTCACTCTCECRCDAEM
ncbi:MAG: hypothetical protein PHT32_01295 [Candidatus Omnitrophica bacterium]|nr:hypothetical protein [Candidatus Omnitrophota bacterium]